MAEKEVECVLCAVAVDVPTGLKSGEDDSPIPLVILNERISCALNETWWRPVHYIFHETRGPSAASKCEAVHQSVFFFFFLLHLFMCLFFVCFVGISFIDNDILKFMLS